MYRPGSSLLFILLIAAVSSGAFARDIYLNGFDISSARAQYLQGVTVRIDEKGDVYIEAPHYQVSEESTYTPLTGQKPETERRNHQGPRPLDRAAKSLELPAKPGIIVDAQDSVTVE